MKKAICLILTLCVVFSFTGCKRKDPSTSTTGSTTGSEQNQQIPNTEQTNTDTSMVAVSVPTVTEESFANDGTVQFRYTYQDISLILHKPDVADKVIVDFLNRVDSTRQAAKDVENMAKSAYNRTANWTPYLYHVTYSPTRVDHDVLSLFGNNVVFSGTPHPDRTCVSANYDLKTGDVLTLASVMSMNASTGDFCNLVLDGLTEMSEGDYLYENYKQTVQQRFTVDASTDEAWYFTQTGLCFYFAPYEIAPYSSGVISVEIPYEKLNNILHPDYLPNQRESTQGSITLVPFEEVDMNATAHRAEIVANRNGSMYMAQASGTVQDVRIVQSDKTSNCTVCAVYSLSPGDGIMIQADEAQLQQMKLTYKSGNETVSMPLK